MFHKKTHDLKHGIVSDDTFLTEIIHPVHNKEDPKTPYSLAHAQLEPNTQSRPHVLTESIETYIIIKGVGEISIENEKEQVYPGSIIIVPPKQIQHIKNTGSTILEFYCIVSPPWTQKYDTIVF